MAIKMLYIFCIILLSPLTTSRHTISHRKKIPPHIRAWRTPAFRKEDRITTVKTTPMFVHKKRSYSLFNYGFVNVSQSGTFIDKTSMIEVLFKHKNNPYHIVTTPRKSGKTINIDMIYRFARLELDKHGRSLDAESTTGYNLFYNGLQISRREKMMRKHLSAYPVMYLNMMGFFMGLRDSAERLDSMSHILKWCAAEYQVLLETYLVRRNETHMKNFQFIRKAIEKQLTYVDMQNSLYMFSQILHRHFNKKVLLLIDDFDYPFNSAVSKGFGYEMIDLFVTMLDRLFQPVDDECHVAYALMTGGSNTMAALIASKINSIQHHRSFEDHMFTPYFGITDEELGVLLYHPKLTFIERLNIPKLFAGYLVRDTSHVILNTYSVTQHIKEDCMIYDPWFSTKSITSFTVFLRNKEIYEYMIQLVFLNFITIELFPYLYLSDLNELWSIERLEKHPYDLDARIFFSFLFETGYLSYTEQPHIYRTPNEEISSGLKTFMIEFYNLYHEKSELNKWDKDDSLRRIFETGNVTDEMLSKFQSALQILVNRSEHLNIRPDLILLHYQALVYYTARRHLGDVQIKYAIHCENPQLDFTEMTHIVVIDVPSIITLIIALRNRGSVIKATEHAQQYALPEEMNAPAMMIKYLGIYFGEDSPQIDYNYSGSIDAESYYSLITTTTSAPVTKKKRKKYTRETYMTRVSFPKLPKKIKELFWFDGKEAPKRARTIIDALY